MWAGPLKLPNANMAFAKQTPDIRLPVKQAQAGKYLQPHVCTWHVDTTRIPYSDPEHLLDWSAEVCAELPFRS